MGGAHLSNRSPFWTGANPSLCAMSVGTPPPWWWLASDGRWYPPELRRRDHVALRQSSVGAARQPRLRLVSSALVVGILVAATGLGVTAASSARYSDPGARSAAVIAPVAPSTSAIWFQPQPPGVFGPFGQVPSAHYLALFRPGAPWQRVMAHTQAVGFYAGWIYSASNKVLRPIVNFLNTHGIGIEIESPALQALPTCGAGVEGYVPYGLSGLDLRSFTLAYLQKLKALGAHVLFVKVDEPYYFGNVVSDAALQQIALAAGDKTSPVSCHFSVPQVAREVGRFAKLVKTVYPAAEIGDVEPVRPDTYDPNAVTALDTWLDTYRLVNGAPFPFFFADVDFSDPAWPALLQQLAVSSHLRGTRFGIIYIGDTQDSSDAEWTSQVVARFDEYQGQDQGRPDYVLFQSWQPEPTLCLPESDPTTFTGVIDTYITTTAAQGTEALAGPTRKPSI
jgi:hypothetical protein